MEASTTRPTAAQVRAIRWANGDPLCDKPRPDVRDRCERAGWIERGSGSEGGEWSATPTGLAAIGVPQQEYQSRRTELEALLASAQERAAAAMDDCTRHHRAIEELDAERLRGLTDAEIMASDELRLWLCGLSGQEAYKRYRALQEQGLPESLRVAGQDGRDEWYGYQLPCLYVALKRRQSVEGLPDIIRAWAERWALGRPDMPLLIIEQSLSANSSWQMHWNITSDVCRVEKQTYGITSVVYDGHLADALAWVARHAWYEDPDDD